MKTLNPLTTSSSLLALLVALGVPPTEAEAYYLETRGAEEEGTPVRYAEGEDDPTPDVIEVEYRVNTASIPESLGGASDAIHGAFSAWSNVDCSMLSFVDGGETDSMDKTHWMYDDGEIYVLVYFDSGEDEWYMGPSVGKFFWAHDGTGNLIGGTVVLNSKDHAWATDGSPGVLDVQSIVTALVGRSLGITSAAEGNATFPRYSGGDTSKRELGDDDLAAVQYLYSAGGEECEEPDAPDDVCDGFAAMCPPRPMTSGGGGTRDAGTPGGGGRDAGTPGGGAVDAGPSFGADGGVAGGSTDPGVDGTGDSGGGCSAGGRGSAAWLLLLGLLAWRRRR